MSVKVVKSGLFDTIQDEGRYGFQHLGINPGGSMDLASAMLANTLVDNEETGPVLELHFPASVFMFTQNCLVAITGADFNPEINGSAVPLNTSILVSKNSVLNFRRVNAGARCYLAIRGKWKINRWLNSYSTNTKAGAGGFEGRRLQKTDLIYVEPLKWKVGHNNTTVILPVKTSQSSLSESNVIRLVKGSEFEHLADESKKELTSQLYKISVQSDRMGYRLEGNFLKGEVQTQLLSTAVTRGTVQLLPLGQLIVLMADHQTTGGYPKIAHVISADFSRLAQMQLNNNLQFEFIDQEEAENLFIQQQENLQASIKDIQAQFLKMFK